MIDEGRRERLLLEAIRLKETAIEIVPARHERPWMDASKIRFAYRCLPLLMANQLGWNIILDSGFTVQWIGGEDPSSLTIDLDETEPSDPPISHFGDGIITWNLPFLFRTPPGWNLLARGPANVPKDGISPLEGLVETDWTYTPFTMNWKVTRPHHPIRFERGEAICTILPQPRYGLEAFQATYRALHDMPETERNYAAWAESREAFSRTKRSDWQKHYFRGVTPWGDRAPDHQTKLRLCPFGVPDDPSSLDED